MTPTDTRRPEADNRITAGARAARSTVKGDLPPELLDRYLIERDGRGRPERFYRDHRAAEPVFRDTGRSLVATSAYPDAITDMLKVAHHRGWTQVAVRGDESFRREVWIRSRALGIDVKGYRPRDRDRQAAGEPARADPDAALDRRVARAALVVRALLSDPEAQRRVMEHALSRVAAFRDRRGDRPQDRARER